ncbi:MULTISPECIES: MFS transporter [unclassified Curtobacterium]|jgi:MFS family permease|uniref:MFS transporter n=1 Tax=unclassified Curtobacterium TaxID=257496 RepID=UPI00052A21EB|nr:MULTISPECIES: MFS transporter [unclassified Curtobacterium]AIV40819.1 MFS transporter [Curtobacterium sp. MR_MD2014]MBP1302954.1 MFS family permease [Curtobacterium sp. 1310]MCM3506624.1 MFS transporter [Curtobacterium sp. ODYSSEY 48 V2]MDB6427151.1 MFS transporter [Curtobacterium sp. 20TX0008]MDT0212185.1 MFS transporter [Curtobacterium sp. BRD11]
MSTPTSKEEPQSGLAGTANPPVTAAAGATSTDPAAASRAFSVEGLTQNVSTVRVGPKYLWALSLAQFGLFAALLTPVFVGMAIKATVLNPDSPETIVGSVLPFGALGALLANPLAGALSDRTRTRWGRRRPWMVGGVVVFVVALAWLAFAPDVLQLTIAWVLAQVAANAVLATLTASFADNVPEFQRGKASSVIALAQNIAILAGLYLAVYLVGNLPVLFIAPGILAIVVILVYAVVARDELPATTKPFSWVTLIASFWTNPIKHPDFGLAWWGRFLITFGTFMFTTYRVLYMQEQIGIEDLAEATATVAFGVLLYTVALLVSAAVSGWVSDRVRRRKVFVWGSTALTAVGLVILAHVDSVGGFYFAEIVLGFAFGIYAAIDTALVVDVLPDPERPGKDLGVINIANALPQSLAPAVGLFLLGLGGGQNYTLMLWGAGVAVLLGALVILPIKKVR